MTESIPLSVIVDDPWHHRLATTNPSTDGTILGRVAGQVDVIATATGQPRETVLPMVAAYISTGQQDKVGRFIAGRDTPTTRTAPK